MQWLEKNEETSTDNQGLKAGMGAGKHLTIWPISMRGKN